MGILSVAQKTFSSAFKGAYAAKNTKLLERMEQNGMFMRGDKLTGVRNGIAVIEEPFTQNFGTTKVRHFITLKDNGELTTLKSKAIYNVTPGQSDIRSMSGAWSYDHRTGMMSHRSSISVNGKLREVSLYKEKGRGSDVAGQFYYLPSLQHNLKLYSELDYKNGYYSKILQDTSGNKGIGFEYGRLKGDGTKEKLSSLSYNPNLGQIMGKDWYPYSDSFRFLNDGNLSIGEILKKYISKS